jgi:hypothetical protein
MTAFGVLGVAIHGHPRLERSYRARYIVESVALLRAKDQKAQAPATSEPGAWSSVVGGVAGEPSNGCGGHQPPCIGAGKEGWLHSLRSPTTTTAEAIEDLEQLSGTWVGGRGERAAWVEEVVSSCCWRVTFYPAGKLKRTGMHLLLLSLKV